MEKINYNNLYNIRRQSLIFVQFIVFRALGLSPWTFYHFEEFYGYKKINYLNLEYCLSYWGSSYNIVLSAFIITTNYLYFFSNTDFIENMRSMLSSYSYAYIHIKIYLRAASFTSTAIVLWNYVSLQARIINFLNRLQRVDIKLIKDSKYEPKNATGFCLMFFINLFVSISLMVMHPTTDLQLEYFFKDFLYMFTSGFPIVFYNWMILQYIMMLNLTMRRIKKVNSLILEIGIDENDNVLNNQASERELCCLKEVYMHLCKLQDGLVSFYGIPILIAVINIGGLSLFIVYNIYDLNSLYPLGTKDYVIYGIWLIWMIFFIIVVFITFIRAKIEEKKAKNNLCSLLRRYSMDERFKYELDELLHNRWPQEVDVKFDDLVSFEDIFPQSESLIN
ncbi:uncharacterized protein LOC130674064 [Microplitis mediator]|uniref:uncharacterized protein LOC130674064 n=1 Tax=Microplitis mediator TaxID=375433 RepID=UPI002555374E|nr:uncharacterized protein LOC130674064 [Microplitis mediator]